MRLVMCDSMVLKRAVEYVNSSFACNCVILTYLLNMQLMNVNKKNLCNLKAVIRCIEKKIQLS